MNHLRIITIATLVALMSTSCDLLGPDQPVEIQVEDGFVNFEPTLYGEVVPWLNTATKKAGFVDYTHKYFSHVIRIYDDANTWLVDIPITDEGQAGNNGYS